MTRPESRRVGFAVRAYHPNGFRDVLRLRGQYPDLQIEGHYGIPIRDVIELSKPA